jgi:esterase/lipase superfamily enzyme
MKKYPPALTVTKLYKYRAADIFCFSWPSQGKLDLNSYKADRDAAAKSVNAIADSLRKLSRF